MHMMPLAMATKGEEQLIKKVGGKEETRLFLEKLGFVPGSKVSVVSEADHYQCQGFTRGNWKRNGTENYGLNRTEKVCFK